MKLHLLVALAALGASACASMPSLPTGQAEPSGFTEEAMSGGRMRIVYQAPAADVTTKTVADRTLARAAQVTLDKGNEWFEIASKVDGKMGGKNTQTLVIVMGSGEALAGGPKQYDAKATLASLRDKIG
jgi:hypothetical protein